MQVLPFAEEDTIAQLEANIAAAGPVTNLLHEGAGARDITEALLKGLGVSDTGFTLRPRYLGWGGVSVVAGREDKGIRECGAGRAGCKWCCVVLA